MWINPSKWHICTALTLNLWQPFYSNVDCTNPLSIRVLYRKCVGGISISLLWDVMIFEYRLPGCSPILLKVWWCYVIRITSRIKNKCLQVSIMQQKFQGFWRLIKPTRYSIDNENYWTVDLKDSECINQCLYFRDHIFYIYEAFQNDFVFKMLLFITNIYV